MSEPKPRLFLHSDWFCPYCPLTFRIGRPQPNDASVYCPFCGVETLPACWSKLADIQEGIALLDEGAVQCQCCWQEALRPRPVPGEGKPCAAQPCSWPEDDDIPF